MGRKRHKTGTSTKSKISSSQGYAETDICAKCEQVIDSASKALMCDECEMWFCSQCLGISDELYDIMNRQDIDHLKVNCDNCKSRPTSSVIKQQILDMQTKTMGMLSTQFAKLENNLSASLETMIKNQMDKYFDQKFSEHFREQIDSKIVQSSKTIESRIMNQVDLRLKQVIQESKVDNTKSDIAKVVEEANKEARDKEQRKSNLIIFNLKESEKKSFEDQLSHDYDKVKEIVKTLDLPESITVDIKRIHRLGDSNKKDRPLKIVLYNPGVRFELIKRYKKLLESRDSEIRKVVISLDRTVKERNVYKALKQEIKKREAKGETDLIIRKGEIVKITKRPEVSDKSKKQPRLYMGNKGAVRSSMIMGEEKYSNDGGAVGGVSHINQSQGKLFEDHLYSDESRDEPQVFSDSELDYLTRSTVRQETPIRPNSGLLQEQVRNIRVQPTLQFIHSGEATNALSSADTIGVTASQRMSNSS